MIYIKSKKYDTKRILDRIMGPNPVQAGRRAPEKLPDTARRDRRHDRIRSRILSAAVRNSEDDFCRRRLNFLTGG
ncbi:MAG: hypothetical protein E7519_11375 [Ruminococcaceae bacterium]|nr:hypothetical protein [Oscillospiraceae bacterium]